MHRPVASEPSDRRSVTITLRLPRWTPATLAVLAVVVLLWPVAAAATDRFPDVPSSGTFHDDIGWMADTRISEGFSDGQFKPGRGVTRAEMAAFMRRLSGDDPTVAPVVDAAALGGTDAASVLGELVALRAEVDALNTLLADVSLNGDTLVLDGVNLQLRSGAGATDATPNGLGNLIIGYNADATFEDETRTGSHSLVIGDEHTWTSYGHLIAGDDNSATAPGASVTGGQNGDADARYATVTGGRDNTASGDYATVTGGTDNVAGGVFSTVTGGLSNSASGGSTVVGGGTQNTASGTASSISGGRENATGAGGDYAVVSGGRGNDADHDHATVGGGSFRATINANDWVAGSLRENS